jgi:chemotaxis protein histidine kinase CheA
MADDPKTQAMVFYADNRFERMARRPGGVARDQALEAAHAHLEDLKADFADWINQELAQLADALAKVETQPLDLAAIDAAFHSSAHLRDVGGTMGFELVTFIANNLCDIIDALKLGASYDKGTIDCHMDALALAKTEQYRHLMPDQVPEMTKGLRRISEIASIVPEDHAK